MQSSRGSTPLETLIYSVLPGLCQLPDRVQAERVAELKEYCEDILASRIPSSLPLGTNALPDAARRLLPSTNDSLRFNAHWNTIERNRTLAHPNKHLQFLLALSELNKSGSEAFPAASSSRRPPSQPNSYSRNHGHAGTSGLGTPAPPRVAPGAVIGESSRRGTQESQNPNHAPSPPRQGKSKAALLREWRTDRHRKPFPEPLLLRDALYLLQGIDGRYVRFALAPPPERNPYLTEKGRDGDGTGFPLGANGANGVVPDPDAAEVVGINIVADETKDGFVTQPTRSILVQLSELGVLYRQITSFVREHQAAGPSSRSGMIVQSLCHFLHHELSEYHRLLAVLEGQMNITGSDDAPLDGGLTLIRLGLWTEDMRLKLRLMDSVVNDARRAHGGALVSKIHKHTAHGDPFVRQFTDQILEEVSKPFFLTLQRWIISGELHDPFNEFFVQPNPDITSDDVSPYAAGDLGFEEGLDAGSGTSDAHQVWEKRYIFVKAMMPSFINEDFGKKIFSTGRSLNFIRYNCYDSDWVAEQAALSSTGEALKYSDLNGLERSIDVAYSKASKHLLEIFYEKYRLMDHVVALKSYLMLGAGDFVDLLMESLSTRLDRPAISLYRHHLTSDLESAIRGSSAQYDSPDVLRRLDARVNEYSRGEMGWDCFALEYRVEAPLNAILDARAMEGYARLFHHLWRLKRVETALTAGWMRVTAASRTFEALPHLEGLWHSCRLMQAEMVHFLRNMQAFCQLEVIECSWKALCEVTNRRDGDLDALISAHRTYLDRVVRKILLLQGSQGKDDALLNLVREALDHILAFRAATEELYKWSLGEATRLDRIRGPEKGLPADDARAAENEEDMSLAKLAQIRASIETCSNGFQDTVAVVCKEAAAHPDLDVRFFAIRIAFNGYYSLRRERKKK